MNGVLVYCYLFWSGLCRMGIGPEWALLLVAILNFVAIFAVIGLFCARPVLGKLAFFLLFLANLAILVVELETQAKSISTGEYSDPLGD